MPDRKYVFDTVSISNFSLSKSLELIIKRYNRRAFITSEVYDEILDGITHGHDDLCSIERLLKDKSLKFLNLREGDHEIYKTFLKSLGKGEASSIAVSLRRKMILVTDDKAARNIARELKIGVTGTIGILKASVSDRLISIDEADLILNKMIASGFYSPVKSISHIE